MRPVIKEYIQLFNKTLNLSGICWWVIDYEYEPDFFYCNDFMAETFCLDKNLPRHSIQETCPIAGDYNKNIDLASDDKTKASQIFDDYARLVNQEIDEYCNVFPYYNSETDQKMYFTSRAIVLERTDDKKVSILYGIIEDITAHKTNEKELVKRAKIEKIVSQVASQLLFPVDVGINLVIDNVLSELGSFSHASRCYLFQYSDDGRLMSNTHEWCAPGVVPAIEELQEVPIVSLPYFNEFMQKHQIFDVPKVSELPDEAKVEKELFGSQEIQSLICVPITFGKKLYGFIGFDCTTQDHFWTNPEIDLLKTIADNMASALEREHILSELKRHEEQLKQKIDLALEEATERDQMLYHQSRLASIGEMVSQIAHQWRQPLNALGLVIQENRDLYDEGLLDRSKLIYNTDKAMEIIGQMSHTIDDFRYFYRSNKQKEVFAISECCQLIESIFSMTLINNDISMRKSFEKDFQIFGYKNEMSHAMLNIINNAYETLLANRIENPSISIYITQLDESFNQIRIEDNAGGIPEEILPRIFDPYFTTKSECNGTGIGLYMSKNIIETNHSGKILVSNGKEGACFRVLLPVLK